MIKSFEAFTRCIIMQSVSQPSPWERAWEDLKVGPSTGIPDTARRQGILGSRLWFALGLAIAVLKGESQQNKISLSLILIFLSFSFPLSNSQVYMRDNYIKTIFTNYQFSYVFILLSNELLKLFSTFYFKFDEKKKEISSSADSLTQCL